MAYRFVALLIFFHFSFSLFAEKHQVKERLKIVFKKDAPGKLYLCSFYGIDISRIDSAFVNSSGTFSFSDSPEIKKGFFRIMENDTNYVDVILSPLERPELTVETRSLKNGVVVNKSAENKALWALKEHRTAFNKQKKIFLSQLNDPANVAKRERIRRSIDSLELSENRFTSSLLEKNRNTYFYLTSKSILSPLYTDSALLRTKYSNDTSLFMKENFFNNIDFSKEEIVNSTLIPNQLMKYFERYVDYDEAGFKSAVDLVLSKAKANNTVYELSLDFLLRLFNEAGPEAVFEYIVQKYYDKSTCSREYMEKADRMRSLSVGNIIPEIGIPGSSKYASLKDIYSENRLTLVYFWSSHCGFCMEATPLITGAYSRNRSKGLEIVGFSIDENENDWKKYVEDNKLSWLNFNELKGWDSKVVRELMVNKTPTYFLIGRNGIILVKNHNFVDMQAKINNLLDQTGVQ